MLNGHATSDSVRYDKIVEDLLQHGDPRDPVGLQGPGLVMRFNASAASGDAQALTPQWTVVLLFFP